MCGALFALDLILLYHFVSTFIVPLPIFARPFDLLLGFLFPSLPAFSTSMFLPFLPFCLVPILVPSLLLLPLSSPSNLISLRPFLLLLLCPPSTPYFSFFMSSFPRYHSGAGGSSPLSPRFSSLVSSIDIENPLLLISDARQKYDPFPSSVFSSLPQIANASSSSAYPLCTGAAFTFFLLGHVIPNHCSRNVSSEVEHSLSVVSVFFPSGLDVYPGPPYGPVSFVFTHHVVVVTHFVGSSATRSCPNQCWAVVPFNLDVGGLHS